MKTPEKICKCTIIDGENIPEDGSIKRAPITIAPDESGQLWYWDSPFLIAAIPFDPSKEWCGALQSSE